MIKNIRTWIAVAGMAGVMALSATVFAEDVPMTEEEIFFVEDFDEEDGEEALIIAEEEEEFLEADALTEEEEGPLVDFNRIIISGSEGGGFLTEGSSHAVGEVEIENESGETVTVTECKSCNEELATIWQPDYYQDIFSSVLSPGDYTRYLLMPAPGLEPGDYEVDIRITLEDDNGYTCVKTCLYTFSIGSMLEKIILTPSSFSKDFGTLVEGYEVSAAESFTIKNSLAFSLTVVRPASEHYLITGLEEQAEIASDESLTFTVKPKENLPAGIYDEELEIHFSKAESSLDRTKTLSFKLTVAPDYYNDISISPETLDFGTLKAGYTVPAAQSFTVTNSGETDVTIATPVSDHYWIESVEETAVLRKNSSATFTVAPKGKLPVGHHAEELPVVFLGTEGNEIFRRTVSLDFTVEHRINKDQIVFDPPFGLDNGMELYSTNWRRFTVTNYNTEEVTIVDCGISPLYFVHDTDKFVVEKVSSSNVISDNGGSATFRIKPTEEASWIVEERSISAKVWISIADIYGNVIKYECPVYYRYNDCRISPVSLDFGTRISGSDSTVETQTISVTTDCTTPGRYLSRTTAENFKISYLQGEYKYTIDRMPIDKDTPFTLVVEPKSNIMDIPGNYDETIVVTVTDGAGHPVNSQAIDLKYTVVQAEDQHLVKIHAYGGGRVEPDLLYVKEGKVGSFRAIPKDGCQVVSWEVISGYALMGARKLPELNRPTDFAVTIGEEDVELAVYFSQTDVTLYVIEVENSEGGTGTADPPATTQIGTVINLSATPKGSYVFDHWEVLYGDVVLDNPYSTDTSFAFKGKAVGVKPIFMPKEVAIYLVNIVKSEGGGGTADPPNANYVGETITVTAKPYAAYTFDHWEVLAGDITLDDPNSYITTFTATGKPVTLKPCFRLYSIVSFNTTTIQYEDDEEGGTAVVDPEIQVCGGIVDLSATAKEGYYFKEWKVISGGVDTERSTLARTSFVMGSEDVIIQPVFEPVTIRSLSLDASAAKKKYIEGEELDVDSLILTVTKLDGNTETINVTKDMVSGFNCSVTGFQLLTVTYQGFEDYYVIEVKEKTKPQDSTCIVTYKVVNGTWSDGKAEDRTETVKSGFSPINVPMDMIPSTGYTGGSWDTEPGCATIVTDMVFTYTFRATPGTAVNGSEPSSKITITKKPTIKKPAATKNKITVNWSHFKHTSKKTKKIWKKIKKVQVQCAADKAFTNIIKTVFVGKKKTKGTVKGLKKNTTYYVRIRYYDGTGYSVWSKVKKIKTTK